MLLRKRSRAVTRPAFMADHTSHSQPPPNQNYTKVVQSFFGSPKFRDLTIKCLSRAEALRSPTSILEAIPIPIPLLPFVIPKISSEKKSSWDKMDSKGIGLALVDALKDEGIEQNSEKSNNGNVLLGTQLKVKIPPFTFYPFESQASDGGFGIKSQDSDASPTGSQSSRIYNTQDSSGVVATGVLSLSEMELSEDYTCVISHGPNPRTTHIFQNCVVKSHCSLPDDDHSQSASANFLSFCHTCKKHLEHTNDIFIYRGEKAFCSSECRYQEMILDGAENSEFDSYPHS